MSLQGYGFRLLSALPWAGPIRRPLPTHTILKEALRQQGHPITAEVRAPHRPVTVTQRELIRATLAALARE